MPKSLPKDLLKLQEGGAKARKAFALLGLEAKDFADPSGGILSADASLRKIIDSVAAIEDPTQRAIAATATVTKISVNMVVCLQGEGHPHGASRASGLGQPSRLPAGGAPQHVHH